MNPNSPTYGFSLSTHAVNRLYERHEEIFATPLPEGKRRFDVAYEVLDDSEEEKSFKNNTEFMVYIGEKYGFDKEYRLFCNGNVVFIGIVEGPRKVIVTTIDRRDSTVRHINPGTSFGLSKPIGRSRYLRRRMRE